MKTKTTVILIPASLLALAATMFVVPRAIDSSKCGMRLAVGGEIH